MFTVRRIRSLLGSPVEKQSIYEQLDASDVPVTSADCRTCSNPCDQGHDNYPSRFNVDYNSQLLGTVKPYRRQVLVSTGQSDWDREVTKTVGSLASLLLHVQESMPVDAMAAIQLSDHDNATPRSTAGLFQPTDSNRVSILNANHHSIHDGSETVVVFPDYKVVTHIRSSPEGAQALWDFAIDPVIGRCSLPNKQIPLKSWILPYACVVLLCSHKKRDNRCGIAAPKLEHAFMQNLEAQGWHAETDIDASVCDEDALEDLTTAESDLQHELDEKLKKSSESRRVLILRTSHIGGHKYAGNCVIYTPRGSCVWYGRVSPHEVESIVTNTIIGGLILPPLLRGGLNLSRPGCQTLYDW